MSAVTLDWGRAVDEDRDRFTCHNTSDLVDSIHAEEMVAVEAMLRRGYDPNIQPCKGVANFKVPIAAAIDTGNIDMVRLLVSYGADVDAPGAHLAAITAEDEGRAIFNYVFRASSQKHAFFVLACAHLDPERGGDAKLINLMLSFEQDVSTRHVSKKFNLTPLMAAVKGNTLSMVKYLIEEADPRADPNDYNPACHEGRIAIDFCEPSPKGDEIRAYLEARHSREAGAYSSTPQTSAKTLQPVRPS